MARQRTLTPLIGVRIPVPQPVLFSPSNIFSLTNSTNVAILELNRRSKILKHSLPLNFCFYYITARYTTTQNKPHSPFLPPQHLLQRTKKTTGSIWTH